MSCPLINLLYRAYEFYRNSMLKLQTAIYEENQLSFFFPWTQIPGVRDNLWISSSD